MKRQFYWVVVVLSIAGMLVTANSHKKQLEKNKELKDSSDEQEHHNTGSVERAAESHLSVSSMTDNLSPKELEMLNRMMALMLNSRRIGAAFGGAATGGNLPEGLSSSVDGSHEEASGGFQEEGTLEAILGPAFVPLEVPDGYFVPFLPRRAFGVTNGVSRPAHAHASFYTHRAPGLVNIRNSPAYGYLFTGHRRFQPQLQ